MATFYVLPSRLAVGQRFGAFLSAVFPGLEWQRAAWPDLAETLGLAAASHSDIFVVFREDLADEFQPAESLVRDFGAEPGDQIIEMKPVEGQPGQVAKLPVPGNHYARFEGRVT